MSPIRISPEKEDYIVRVEGFSNAPGAIACKRASNMLY